MSNIELPFGEAAEVTGPALSRRDLLAATAGVVLAGSLAGNAATALAAGTGAKPERRCKESLREVLDFLVTEEQLGVTLVSAAIKNAPGTPSEAFLPVLRNGVTTEYFHVEALKEVGGKPLTTKYWFPDAALDNGGIGVFETLEVIETIEISLYLIGVSAYARRGDDFGARLCAEAMGTEAVHRALVRFAQGELGKQIGPPNDVGFENFDWHTVGAVREALEALGIGYGVETSQPGRFYDYPGDPLANGLGTPVNHTRPR
jgi:hypothetical protein